VSLAVKTFGYASICATFCEDHGIDPQALAADNGWFLQPGLMVHSFNTKSIKLIDWKQLSKLPAQDTKDTIKKIAKEIKKNAK
jgi:hypothetical protein